MRDGYERRWEAEGERRSLNELANASIRLPHHERILLVHNIGGKETLAGIALQYGVSVCLSTIILHQTHKKPSALRQANKLWTSDSIHLKRSLHIPLEACTKPPPNELLLELAFDENTVTIFYSELKTPKIQAPALTTTLLNGFHANAGNLALISPPTSRSGSFDLVRFDGPSSSTLSLLGRRAKLSLESNAVESFLPSTNNVFSDASLEAAEAEIAQSGLQEALPIDSSPRLNSHAEAVLQRVLPIIRQQVAKPTESSSKPRPVPLRNSSFQLSEALGSPPQRTPPTPSKSDPFFKPRYDHLSVPRSAPGNMIKRQSSSSTLSLRDIGSRLGSGNWLAADPEELAIANEIAASARNINRLQARKKKGS